MDPSVRDTTHLISRFDSSLRPRVRSTSPSSSCDVGHHLYRHRQEHSFDQTVTTIYLCDHSPSCFYQIHPTATVLHRMSNTWPQSQRLVTKISCFSTINCRYVRLVTNIHRTVRLSTLTLVFMHFVTMHVSCWTLFSALKMSPCALTSMINNPYTIWIESPHGLQ